MFKYVPVLRCRQAENTALKSLSINGKALPLLEIIQDYPTGRVPQVAKPFGNVYVKEFSSYKHNILVDIPTYIDLKISGIKPAYREFLTRAYAAPENRINLLKSLAPAKNVIPVISYNPHLPYLSNYITVQHTKLKPYFNKLAFRIYSNVSASIMNEIKKVIKEGDILLFDIDNNDYNDPSFQNLFNSIYNMKVAKSITIVIINTPIPNAVTNTSIKHGLTVPNTNNDMLKLYSSKLKFDAFGDYAGIKKDDLVEGFLGYISNIYYSYNANEYIGFSAKPSKEVKDYKSIIAPAIVKSSHWGQYNGKHYLNCPGCRHINDIATGGVTVTSGNRVTWKTISIQHYIYTMQEFL